MAQTLTPNFSWVKPDIGGDASIWGNVLNTTFDAIDAVAFNNQTNQGNYLLLTGGTLTGSLTVNGAVVANGLTNLNGNTVTRASGGGDADFMLANNAGVAVGHFYWTTDNSVHLFNPTGGGNLVINADGSVSTNGAFHTGVLTAAAVSCSGITCTGSATISGTLSSGFANIAGLSCVGSATFSAGINVNGAIGATGIFSRNGISGTNASGAQQYNHFWTGAQNHLFFGDSDWGQIQTNSDYRMKRNIAPLKPMWETVKALNPIRYTHKDWTPPASVESQKGAGGTLIRGDNVERWGFLAHELQETLVESAANGRKDDPVHVQSPNPFTVIAALTRALQEAMERIEALEAAR